MQHRGEVGLMVATYRARGRAKQARARQLTDLGFAVVSFSLAAALMPVMWLGLQALGC